MEILNSRNFCMDLYNENKHFFGRARLSFEIFYLLLRSDFAQVLSFV